MQLGILHFIWQPCLQGPGPAEVEQRSPLALLYLMGLIWDRVVQVNHPGL